ncbi:MAG: phosphoenolpyruvate synthase [Anaerolineae bacterium]|nr:phosphoenolpyruvate synthase [Anaerolineae bacterium]
MSILSLDAEQITLETAGGKGLNLSRLRRAGFPAPPGFIVSAAAYKAFVQINDLAGMIANTLRDIAPGDVQALEAVSHIIRARFAAGQIPAETAAALCQAYADLGNGESLRDSPKQRTQSVAVAVRSSATAEDLPGFSFAGQQDTYLNVIGDDALCRAVIDCWGSLWTARAIGYRTRNGIDQQTVSLAVVVQVMVSSETAGVLFTANPLTGRRSETVIDAILGLGEALVSGQVEPDHYVVDAGGERILSKSLGSKALAIYGQDGGGTIAVEQDAAARQALSNAAILELARLGRGAADLFGAPQDIEWAGVDGRLYLLQSRPITTLYPLPEGLSPEPLKAMFSFGAVQGMLDPMTPLGRDMIRGAFVGGAKLFGYQLDLVSQQVLLEAGERLWINLSGLIKNRLGRRLTLFALESVEPGGRQALVSLLSDGSLPAPGRSRPITLLRLLKVIVPAVGRALRTLVRPERQRERLLHGLEAWLTRWQVAMRATASPGERAALIRRMPDDAFAFILPQFVPRFAMGMATYTLLTKLAARLPGNRPDAQAMMRGLPHNVTTGMDLNLWHTAQAIRADAPSLARCIRVDAAALATEYLSGQLPDVAQTSIGVFMNHYGMRGLGEIDLGRPRWREDPTPLMQAIQSYLRIDDPALAPDRVFERGRLAAEAEIDRLAQMLRSTPGGWIKARLARWAARRMRGLIGLRETPKFYIIRLFGLIREALLADGTRLVAVGMLDRADDVFWLHLTELDALAAGDRRDWKSLVHARQQANAREQQRRQVPRLLLSDGRAFYEGMSATAGQGQAADDGVPPASELVGSPVSPGMAEGAVRVVLDPRSTHLETGEILVCPGTDPSWTPLFLVAGGLVMEVGGMMTHGAVVAREYGIPAVVGVHEATQRLHTGQRVRVDGSTGRVILLQAS